MNSERLADVLNRLNPPSLLVFGDVILDRYTWGAAERVSQEAPVIVLRAEERESRPGGAANVAQMAAALGCKRVTVVGITGDDPEARELTELLARQGVEPRLVQDPGRPTTLKERFMGRAHSRHPHQILRVDRESTAPATGGVANELREHLDAALANHDLVLISDYRKGTCTPELLRYVIQRCNQLGIPTLVDPGRGVGLECYAGAYLVKPNRSETAAIVGQPLTSVESAQRAAQQLVQDYAFHAAVVTLDRDGLVVATAEGDTRHYMTRTRNVYDITGAGDMVLAALGVFLAGGATLDEAVQLANVAAGLEVEKLGVVPVYRAEILQELVRQGVKPHSKVVTLEELKREVERRRQAGQKIVFTNGCFDLLHVGHLHYLQAARKLGDCLIVAINSDDSVRRLKGPERPVINERDRAQLLAGLECVDYVIVFEDDTPHRLLRELRPDILIKGGTYREDQVVGREVVLEYGGKVMVGPMVPGLSTTAIVEKIRRRRVA